MSPIRRRTIALAGAPAILLGTWFFAPSHSAPAPPHASVAIVRVPAQQPAGYSSGVVRQIARGLGDQAVGDVSLDVASAVLVNALGGVTRAEGMVQQVTFIHHMVIGSDSASVSQQPQLLTC
jgi:hypothetical protein